MPPLPSFPLTRESRRYCAPGVAFTGGILSNAAYEDLPEIKRIGELRRLIKEKGAGILPAPFLCSAQAYPQGKSLLRITSPVRPS